MVTTIPPIPPDPSIGNSLSPARRSSTQSQRVAAPRDRVEFGNNGSMSAEQSQQIVLDRAMEQLRAVVDEARMELGVPEGVILDTSPEATANRIADFALGFFSQYAQNNGLADDEAGRAQFSEFIGGAIGRGIEEAREILTALNALNPEINTGIEDTAGFIQQRFDTFILNGLS